MPRIFVATLGTETNTFASFPTGLGQFRNYVWSEDGIARVAPSHTSAPARHWVRRAQEAGWEVVEGLHARARPSGIVTRGAYEFMRDRILAQLAAAGPVDAVVLNLHGAMVAEGYDDCEADLVTRIRGIAGPRACIAAMLDPHAHIDHVLVGAADIIVILKTYPHVDYVERAEEVFGLVERTLAGEARPVTALFDCRSMGIFPLTRAGPMPGFMQALRAAEGRDGILSLSLNHGFPWADVPQAGAKMLAIADGDMALAERAAREFGLRFYDSRAEAALPFTPFEAAIAEARAGGDRPLLLADVADQTGSGAPGDTTHILRALIAAGIRRAAIAVFFDPLAVGICHDAGVGARFTMRIGGKYEPHSGPCLDAEAEVVFLGRDARQSQHTGGDSVLLGDVAVVRVEGIEILMSNRRIGVFVPELFLDHGITIADKQVLVLKNLYKHTDVFAPLVRRQLYVAAPGTSNPDWHELPFRRIPRPIWPLDPDPLGRDAAAAGARP
ncbi:MAG: M81 family metallopeptidase [Rhodobacteraceae bacterium]|jgi:microcystin degradation protein MlrC|nr:M81 family metallopeptidase [Paracoccaceae bacterium]